MKCDPLSLLYTGMYILYLNIYGLYTLYAQKEHIQYIDSSTRTNMYE